MGKFKVTIILYLSIVCLTIFVSICMYACNFVKRFWVFCYVWLPNPRTRQGSFIFQGAIKVWKHPLPKFLEVESPTASFFKLPSNEPVNVLLRVYVIRVTFSSVFHLFTCINLTKFLDFCSLYFLK